MYLEEKVNELERKIIQLEKRIIELAQMESSDKPVLSFFNESIPVPYETYFNDEIRVSINGKKLTCLDEGIERDVLEYYQCGDWLNALLCCEGHLDLDFDEIRNLSKDLQQTKDGCILTVITNIVKDKYTLLVEDALGVDTEEFYIEYGG